MNIITAALLVAVGKTYLPPIFSMMVRLLDSNRFLFMEVLSMFTAYEKAVLTLFRAVPRTGKGSHLHRVRAVGGLLRRIRR